MADHVQYMYDSRDVLTASQICDRHAHDLPLLVIVSRGFYGNREEMSFSTGQVLRLQELRQQRRALVHDDQKRTLSIPLDYTHRFYVGDDHTKALTMEEVVDSCHLPVKVRFADSHMRFDSGSDHASRSLGTLKVIRQHEESYFLANNVVQERLLETVIPIPLYLTEVTFCVVTGVRGLGLMDGGRGLLKSLLHGQALDIDFDSGHGDTEMVQLSAKAIKATDNIYQNIDTNIYINVRQQRQRQQQPPSPRQHEQDPRNPPPQQPRRRPPPSPPSPQQQESQTTTTTTGGECWGQGKGEEEYMNLGTLQRSQMSAEDTDRIDDNFYEPIKTSKSQRVYTALLPERKSPLPPSSPPRGSSPAGVPSHTPASASTFDTELQKALLKRKQKGAGSDTPLNMATPRPDHPPGKKDPPGNNEQTSPFGVSLRPTQQKVNPLAASAEPGTPRPEKASSVTAAAVVGGDSKSGRPPVRAGKPALREKPASLTAKSAGKGVVMKDPEPKAEQEPRSSGSPRSAEGQRSKVSPVPPRVVLQPASPQGADNSENATYVNQEQMAVIQPMRPLGSSRTGSPVTGVSVGGKDRNRGRSGERKGVSSLAKKIEPTQAPPPTQPTTPTTTKPEHTTPITTKPEPTTPTVTKPQADTLPLQAPQPPSLPVDQPLDKWTIQDIQGVLERLNLSQYGPEFKKEQVDGPMLQQLTGDLLKADFGMSNVQVIRLLNFVNTGHLPK